MTSLTEGKFPMTKPSKPNWGNRIILIIFGLLAIVTIGATIYATMGEWNATPPAVTTPTGNSQ